MMRYIVPATSKSWIEIPEHSDFPLQNLPYGIFSTSALPPRLGVAIGNYVLDLAALADEGFLDGLGIANEHFHQPSLNAFIATGQQKWYALRKLLATLLTEGNTTLQSHPKLYDKFLFAQDAVKMHLPVEVRDYTDFYSSIEHATNVGTMFRGKENALMPNWRHLPVGYHGRASSIVVSDTPIRRPKGQMRPDPESPPVFGPSKLLDFELEMAFVVGKNTALGTSIAVEHAEEAIFGMLLFNDWSARDIQKWEYVPLGPFLGKSFASSVSPWLVTLDALEPFRVAGPEQEPCPLPYLKTSGKHNFDIDLQVFIQPDGGGEQLISHSNFKYMYWNMAQQLAHHTINGCNVSVGDMMASGTISGPEEAAYGSMLELTWRGTKPIKLKDGSVRKFLLDGDTLIMRGFAEKEGLRIGFGEVKGEILPAI